MTGLLVSLLVLAAPVAPRLHLWDVPLTVGVAGAWLALDHAAPTLTRTRCPCDRLEAPAFDRLSIDEHWRRGALAANVTLGAQAALSALALGVGDDDLASSASDVGLVGEAVAISGAVTEMAKIGFARPYPYLLRPTADAFQARSGINYASLWSGHTAAGMAMAVATAEILQRRHAPSGLRLAAWIVGPLLALAEGGFQVLQSNHYPSDVAVGALAGAVIGYVVVALH